MTNYDVIYSIIIQTITTLTTIKHDATKDAICQNIMKLQSSIIETKDTPNFFQQLNKIGIFEEFIKITLTNRITRISIITLISNILCIDSNKVDIMIYSQYFDQIWRTDLTVRNSATVLFQMIKLLKSSKSHYDLIATDEQALLFIYQQLSKEQHTNTKFALICIQEILQKHKSGECKLILYNNGAIINAICQKTYNIGHPYNIGPLVAVFVLLSHKINDKRIELKELKIIKEILIQNEITKIWVNLKKNKYIDLQPIVIHHFELIIKYCSTK